MTTTSPEAAHQFTRASSCTEHAAGLLDDALLLISELVTKAVRYGTPPLHLAIECDGGGLKVCVRDGASALPPQRHLASGVDESGWGLALVDAMSHAWGVEPVNDEHGRGKAVWFELRPPD